MGRKSKNLVRSCFTKKGIGAECNYCKKMYMAANVTKMASHLSSSCLQCPSKIRKSVRENRTENTLAQERVESEQGDVSMSSDSSSTFSTSMNTSGLSNSSNLSSNGLRNFFDNISAGTNDELQEQMAKAIYVTGTPLGMFEHPILCDHLSSCQLEKWFQQLC